jgi:predicted AlkP superfamily pyrophosphatase or phosphodiesterase
MKHLRFLVLSFLFLIASSISAKRTTVVVSLDGYRWDYPQWYDTPFIDFMAAHGVASGLIPSFPSKTFPNHYTLATGLYPDHHGIVANSFYDPETQATFSLGDPHTKFDPHFYGGEPIWNTAQRQGLHTAVFYWPGSDVKIGGSYPDLWYGYDTLPRLTLAERIEGVLGELRKKEEDRPDLIMAYMEQPDGSGHDFGPQSREVRQAVATVDSLLQGLYDGICRLPCAGDINLIVLSDHGMQWVPEDHAVAVRTLLKRSWVRMIDGNLPCNIYAREGCADSIYECLQQLDHTRVWRKAEAPAYLHFGTNPRIGDIVVCPDPSYVIEDRPITAGGTHGYDPTLPEMHAVFRAIGPDFRHVALPHFRNVDVYPLLCHLLGITPAPHDGDLGEVTGMLMP